MDQTIHINGKQLTGISRWTLPRVLRNQDNPYRDAVLDFTNDPGKTDKSQAPECDVNVIVDRFMKTGVLPGVDVQKVYGDFSSVPDYQEALNIVAKASEQFEGLSAKVRDRFDNDPSKFLEFCNDPKNGKEMIQLGLAKERPISQPRSSNEASNKDTPPPSAKKD